jgi:crenactin
MDFGTSDFKFGPITCGEDPLIVNNRGYFPDRKSVMYKAFQSTPNVVVGDEVPLYLQSTEDLSARLVYPMRNGMIEKTDGNAWEVVSALCDYGLRTFASQQNNGFKGYYIVASLSAISPRYMYERLMEIFREKNKGLIRRRNRTWRYHLRSHRVRPWEQPGLSDLEISHPKCSGHIKPRWR